eukprot:CAMPEP_0195604026 /NCGR_PEP_ID=MMETSP0815-20121206/6431_1 /TAXON_ID=97485 /ORGANISM="Prymnesium parvum, Strain Texoma1" /LENGTH=120 /DNA_ID=CAMNT_0040743671 /DNA_START=1135 /DNA_END=1493 /DNA_ORIENTATION=-
MPPQAGQLDVVLQEDSRRRVLLVRRGPSPEHVLFQADVDQPSPHSHDPKRPADGANDLIDLVVDSLVPRSVQREADLDRRSGRAIVRGLKRPYQPGKRGRSVPCNYDRYEWHRGAILYGL